MINTDKETNVIAPDFPEIKHTTSNIYTQLLKAQEEIKTIEKDSSVKVGDKVRYKYASLPSVLSAILPVLRKHRIVFSTSIKAGVGVALSDEVIHFGILDCSLFYADSGEFITSSIPLLVRDAKELWPDGKPKGQANPMQMLGSAITFATRYGILSLVGLAPDMDDDAASTAPTQSTHTPKAEPITPSLTENERGALTYELYNLWVKKEGSVRAADTVKSRSAVARFTAETVDQLPDDKLIEMKEYLKGFQDVIYG